MITLLLVDDDPAIREGLAMRLSLENDMQIVGEAESTERALTLAQQVQPQVVVLDLGLGRQDGMAIVPQLAGFSQVVVLTIRDNSLTRTVAHHAGAAAFVGKSEHPDHLITIIRRTSTQQSHTAPQGHHA